MPFPSPNSFVQQQQQKKKTHQKNPNQQKEKHPQENMHCPTSSVLISPPVLPPCSPLLKQLGQWGRRRATPTLHTRVKVFERLNSALHEFHCKNSPEGLCQHLSAFSRGNSGLSVFCASASSSSSQAVSQEVHRAGEGQGRSAGARVRQKAN